MELTNEQRKYLGLEIIEPAWERVEIPSNCLKPELSTGKDILFFDGDILRKVIWLDDEGSFLENSYYLRTQDDHTMIAPITAKGRPTECIFILAVGVRKGADFALQIIRRRRLIFRQNLQACRV